MTPYLMIGDNFFEPMSMPMGDRNRFVRQAGMSMGPDVDRKGAIAVVRLDGVAVRRTNFWEKYWSGYSTENLKDTIEALALDDEVEAIVLWVDSPGGEAHGVDAAAKEIAEAAKLKPVVAQIQGSAHSAAYYLAAGATRIVMHDEDRLGSIGVVAQVTDYSKAFKDAGLEVYASTTGPLKGMGIPGTELTDEQKAHIDQHVQTIFEDFKSHVAEHRNLSTKQINELATGGVFSSKEALANGLADGIATLDETLSQLRSELGSSKKSNRSNKGEQTVSDNTATNQPQAATIKQLEQALPGASESFLFNCIKEEKTLEQASKDWMAEQAAENKKLREDLAKKDVKPDASGVDDSTVEETGTKKTNASGSAFQERVSELTSQGKDRSVAVRKAIAEDPEAHKTYVQQYNEIHA